MKSIGTENLCISDFVDLSIINNCESIPWSITVLPVDNWSYQWLEYFYPWEPMGQFLKYDAILFMEQKYTGIQKSLCWDIDTFW